MKKSLLTILFCLILTSCGKENTKAYDSYALAKLESFSPYDKLYTENKIIAFPASIEGIKSYSKKDLANLDYNKEVSLSDIYFRIPQKAEIFKKDDEYFIDLPVSEDYKLMISFKDLSEYVDLDLDLLCHKLLGKNKITGSLVSPPIKNIFSELDSIYFISKEGNISYTHFFIKSQTGLIYFIIKEDTSLSQVSEKIMADMIISAYCQGEDPFEIRKSFSDHKDALNVFANKDIYLDDFTMKIPENFKIHQDNENFKSYIAKDGMDLVAEIIVKKDAVEKASLYDIYSLNSGDSYYPGKLVNMGEVHKKNKILTGNIRLYMQTNSMSGKKFVLAKKDSYITVVVAGPLANESLSRSIADSIKESINK